MGVVGLNGERIEREREKNKATAHMCEWGIQNQCKTSMSMGFDLSSIWRWRWIFIRSQKGLQSSSPFSSECDWSSAVALSGIFLLMWSRMDVEQQKENEPIWTERKKYPILCHLFSLVKILCLPIPLDSSIDIVSIGIERHLAPLFVRFFYRLHCASIT